MRTQALNYREHTNKLELMSYQIDFCKHGRFLTNLNDTYVGQSMREFGEWSEAEIILFSSLVGSGDHVLEAGSNIGAHTVWLSKQVGKAGKVLSFEPAIYTHQLLCANLALNECFNVFTHRKAVGESSGTVAFPIVDPLTGNNFGATSILAADGFPTERIDVVCIDDLELQQLDFIKADIEGYEFFLLKGARKTIARFMPTIYLEISPLAGSDCGTRDQLVNELNQYGYKCYYYITPLFNVNNAKGVKSDLFKSQVSIDMVAINPLCYEVLNMAQATVGDTNLVFNGAGVSYRSPLWSDAVIKKRE